MDLIFEGPYLYVLTTKENFLPLNINFWVRDCVDLAAL